MKKILTLISSLALSLAGISSVVSCSTTGGGGGYNPPAPDPKPTPQGIAKCLADLKYSWADIPDDQEFYNEIIADYNPHNLEDLETIAEIQGGLYSELSVGYDNIYNMIKLWLDDNSLVSDLNTALNEVKNQITVLNKISGWNDDLYKTTDTLNTITDFMTFNNDLITNKVQIYADIVKILGFSLDSGITYSQGNLRSLNNYYALMNDGRFGDDIWNNNDRIKLANKMKTIQKEILLYLKE